MINVGIDEVGRGCWAGPVVAGAVILSQTIPGIRDSKLLNKRQREHLNMIILERADAVGIGWASATTIDDIGLTAAVSLAMQRALDTIQHTYQQIIIDGSYNFLSENPKALAVVKADTTVPAVSAASIIAKVARDQYMTELGPAYHQYGFERHVGYGTVLHRDRLALHGVSDQHRRSFRPVRALLK